MVTQELLDISTEVSAAFLNKASIEKTFFRRINEQIRRAEALTLKKKLDTITLSIISCLAILTSILLILEIRLDFFINDTDKIYIPVILLALLVILSVLLSIEFFLVKNKGEAILNKKFGQISDINKKLMELQKRNTIVYNLVKNSFESIQKVDSKYLLQGLTIHYYVFLTKNEHEFSIEKLYRYLFLIITKKNILFNRIIKAENEIEVIKSNVLDHLPNIEYIFTKFSEMIFLPNYFIISALKSLEIISQFKLTKGEFVIKKNKKESKDMG